MSNIVAIAAVLILLAAGVPIFVTLGTVALVMLAFEGRPLFDAALTATSGLNSSTFLAVPFFVIAAAVMQRGGVARVLIDAAQAWVGWARGGLALVCVMATTFFAAISGSSVVTAMAMGTFLIPAMVERGYDRPFALGVVGVSGTLGILIPPSLAMILYGLIAEESVPRLFLAGVVPGLIQASLIALVVYVQASRRGYQADRRPTGREFALANLRALPALVIPLVIFFGIYSGYTTVAEAAGLAAITALLVTLVFYRELPLAEIFEVVTEGVKSAGAITFIVVFALLFAHWITGSGVPTKVVNYAVGWNLSSWQFLLIFNLLMIILGMFLDAIACILIVVPIVLPLLDTLGIDKIHFGILLVVNMEIAFLTPPIGLNLFVISSVAKAPLAETVRGVAPFIVLMLGFLLLITFVPEISTWLPSRIFAK